MAASSSPPSSFGRCEPFSCSSLDVPAHDIFLSHSGAQKPFVNSLYQLLRSRYSTFFDITHHSLPLGERFAPHIFRAAQTCRLAVVVLSEKYAQSKRPMLELCAFFAADPPPKILPLFLELTVNDLKKEENLNKWHSAWQKFAEKDPTRIDVSKWKAAWEKVSSFNGITLKQYEEESAYIDRVFSVICEILPPSIRHDFSGIQGIRRLSEAVLAEFAALDNHGSKVCVLGMYGLVGSGKSTICRYLCEYLFSQFAGKAIYLELSIGADNEELLMKSKELLKQLTNFNNKMDLSCVSNFREVYHLLKGTDIVSSRVFLVVDNISSQKSGNLVKALLRLRLTVGSKVLLVARSINTLRPLLQEDGLYESRHYVYGSMSVPCLNKEEALRVLLQSGDGVGLADSYSPEAALTPRHKQIMEEVLSMSGFREEHGCIIYLPLHLQIMGEQLKEHELDVEKWNRTVKSFLVQAGLCKEEAVKQMVLKSFETLSGRLQALFLDVALFIMPLSYSDCESHKLGEACSHLSYIHGCESEEIEFEMQKLQQHSFLMIRKGWNSIPIISVHDFYLEFAASTEEASKYYWSSGLRWSKIQRNQAIEAVGTTQLELRTVVLELNEGCEHFEASSDFSRVRALVLRNCKSLKTLRGFANLISLVSLEIHNCPSLKWVEPPATGQKQPYVQRFRWVNQNNKKSSEEMLQQQESVTSSLKKAIWRLFWDNLPQVVGFKSSLMTVDVLLLQMKGLQELRLENTGITQSVDMCGGLLQLRTLEVRERHMKCVRVCDFPNLERFVFFGDGNPPHRDDIACHHDVSLDHLRARPCGSLVPRGRVLGKEFLAGCPKLKEVCLQYIALEDEANHITFTSSHLTRLRVNGLWNVSRLSAFSEYLKELLLWKCTELRSLNFGCIFKNLRKLYLESCHNLTEVSGFGSLSRLKTLAMMKCTSLKTVSCLGGLQSLESITVRECPNIHRWLLGDLESSIELDKIDYEGPENVNGALDVRKWVKITSLRVYYSSCKLIGLESLERIEALMLKGQTPKYSTGHTSLVDLATHLGIMAPCCFSLTSLTLSNLENLRSSNGIEYLGSLKELIIWSVPNLSCLRGIECLRELQKLDVCDCASVEEMPSMSTLVKLKSLCITDCKKLRSVEGCDELEQLQDVWVTFCRSLAGFPSDWRKWKGSVDWVNIVGCKFAGGEAVVAWAEDEVVPEPFRHASLLALRWELSNTHSKTTSEMLLERVIQKALNRSLHDKEDDGDGDDRGTDEEKDEEIVAPMKRKRRRRMRRMPKMKRTRLELSNTNSKTTSEVSMDMVVQKALNSSLNDEEADDDDNNCGTDDEDEEDDDDGNYEEDDDNDNCGTDDEEDEEEEDNDGNYEDEVLVARVSWLANYFDYGDFHKTDCGHDLTCREIYDRVWLRDKALEEGLGCFAKLPKQRLIDLCQCHAHFPSLLYYLFHYTCSLFECPYLYR